MIEHLAPEIRAAIAADPSADDRTIARRLKIRAWTRVRDVRAAFAAELPAPKPVLPLPGAVARYSAKRLREDPIDGATAYGLRIEYLRFRALDFRILEVRYE